MIRNQEAFDSSRAKKQKALDKKIEIATLHLPRIVAVKHDGKVTAITRDDLRDILIRDGVLGSRWNARHIANAKKHNKPLNQWEQLTAETVVDQALIRAEADGKIAITSGKSGLEVQYIGQDYSSMIESEDSHVVDPDELYPLSSILPTHRAINWGLQRAHE